MGPPSANEEGYILGSLSGAPGGTQVRGAPKPPRKLETQVFRGTQTRRAGGLRGWVLSPGLQEQRFSRGLSSVQ